MRAHAATPVFTKTDHDQWKDFADKLAQINERAGGME